MKPGKFKPETVEQAKAVIIYEANTPGELHVMHYRLDEPGNVPDGMEAMLTHWYPTAEEISRMIEGKPVALSIVGTRHPWVKLEVPE